MRTGRVALVVEARDAAREAVLTRYSAGSFHPTFVALNWGISQGTIENRVAIAETLADAAAAAVVADVLDPEIATAIALDATAITNLAAGEASDWSLARALRNPDDPELGPGPVGRRLRWAGGAGMVGAAAIVTGLGALGATMIGVVAAVRALTRGRKRER